MGPFKGMAPLPNLTTHLLLLECLCKISRPWEIEMGLCFPPFFDKRPLQSSPLIRNFVQVRRGIRIRSSETETQRVKIRCNTGNKMSFFA